MYAAARARSGKNTGPRRLRSTATIIATIRTKISAVTKMKTFRQNFSTILGNASAKISGSKNASLISGQPEEVTTAKTITPKNTIVLTTAIATPRAPSVRSGARIFDPRSPDGTPA